MPPSRKRSDSAAERGADTGGVKFESFSAEARAQLLEVQMLTRMLREHQEQIELIGQRRARILLELHNRRHHPTAPERVRYEDMATAMGVTVPVVYRALSQSDAAREMGRERVPRAQKAARKAGEAANANPTQNPGGDEGTADATVPARSAKRTAGARTPTKAAAKTTARTTAKSAASKPPVAKTAAKRASAPTRTRKTNGG